MSNNHTICIHQFIRPKYHINVEGMGNCTICEADENNKFCKNYHPISVATTNNGEE